MSLHGPFFDLIAVSRDNEIVTASRRRYDTALAAGRNIGDSFYVTHTNFMPQFRFPSYRKNWIKRTLDFWFPLADEAGRAGIVICLENVREPTPDIQAGLISTGNHPHLRATRDIGHTLVFSDIPSVKWVKTLGPMLVHCHLYDNSGEYDEHKPIGEGKEDWDKLMVALKEYSPHAILVDESDSLDDNKSSI